LIQLGGALKWSCGCQAAMVEAAGAAASIGAEGCWAAALAAEVTANARRTIPERRVGEKRGL
jgi:hypothetical protein